MLQTSFNKLFEFLQKEILCDVTIQAGNKSIKCHRNVLASCSPYFQAMFTSSLAESKQNVITIGDIDETTMEMLIKFAYTAKVDLNTSNAQALLHASSVLQFDCLAQACCDFMSSQLHPSNCLGIRELAQRLGQLSLVKKSDSFSKYNFRKIIVEDEFVSISVQHLEEIISSEDLFVDNEVEACLSSLALSSKPSDPDDLSILMADNFRIEEPLTAVSDTDFFSSKVNRLTITSRDSSPNSFWTRRIYEYVSRFQQCPKWFTHKSNLETENLVLIKHENPSLKSHLGRIVDVFPGKGNCVRIESVKTSDGLFKRPVTK
ncbi:kelch-like protein 20 [Trichonephila inaurata madagascariensis]|uniref:Kelch-like protein 20 n=1 Tax=Trichonephila inaurata madagascariensis TaxID=2747483 RepID=A0A8X6X871_9ARAC|nr:kelch-like protein 20 [Trichonephila inaurata madagascariensis]